MQILGGCRMFQGQTGEPPLHQLETGPGTVMIIPADKPHYGINTYGIEGVSLRLNVASPPRAEYGSKEKPAVFTHQSKETPR